MTHHDLNACLWDSREIVPDMFPIPITSKPLFSQCGVVLTPFPAYAGVTEKPNLSPDCPVVPYGNLLVGIALLIFASFGL